MDYYEKARRESYNLVVNPFYSEEAMNSFRQWLNQKSEDSMNYQAETESSYYMEREE